LGLVEVAGLIVVLDRTTDCACLGDSLDRARGILRSRAVAVLEVDRQRDLRRPVDRRHVLDDLVERRPAVETPEGKREARARSCESSESEGLELSSRAGVPGIGDHERLARVQRCERFGLARDALVHYGMLPPWPARRESSPPN